MWPGVNQEVRSQPGGSHEEVRRLGVGYEAARRQLKRKLVIKCLGGL